MNGSSKPIQNRKGIQVTKQQADMLREEAKQFEAKLEQEKASFSFSETSEYYIVSAMFLEQWRDYATAHTLQRYLPQEMNFDILKQNGRLKKDLQQGVNFEFLSDKLFQTFKDFPGIAVKRRAVTVGTEKRVPIYLNEYRYMIITHQDLRKIDRGEKGVSTMSTKQVEASPEQTIQDFINLIRANERMVMNREIRLWKIGNASMTKIYSHIKKQTTPIASYQFTIRFIGKKLEQKGVKLGDLELEENQFFVVESKGELQKWHFYSDNEGKCEECSRFTELKFICGCKRVAYCTEQCQEKDRHYHIRFCNFAEMEELNKKIEMTMTPQSSRGVVGLSNLGNTCFMNSCLQCLSNTVPLSYYFIQGHFENEVNKTNPIGTGGKLAKTYAKFIKSMWCDSNSTFSPYNIKSAVSSINPMFSGYAQHDSQQFFSFLVDGLHQDLNRVEKKPFVESVDSNGRPDKQVALESWIAHIKRNQSIIVDLMTGQYKSKVTCPDCELDSITFDPFITATLPIPQKTTHFVRFYVIYGDFHIKTEKYYLVYEKQSAQIWIKNAAKLLGLEKGTFGLYLVSISEGLYKVGRDSLAQIISKIQTQSKNLFLVQYTKQDLQISEENIMEITTRFAKFTSYDLQNLWFKFPFRFDRRTSTGRDVYIRILRFLYGKCYRRKQEDDDDDDQQGMDIQYDHERSGQKKIQKKSKRLNEYKQYQKEFLQKRPFKIIMKSGRKVEKMYHKTIFKFENQEEILDDTRLAQLIGKEKLHHFQIDVRFQKKDLVDFNFQNLKDYNDKMKEPRPQRSEDVTVTLDQCFQNLREVEKLGAGNQWYCPKCKEHKQANKQLSIFKAPKILIIHLKRFKQKGTFRKEKNQSKVQFPMQLDMKDYLIDPNPMSSYTEHAKKAQVYIQPSMDKPISANKRPIYELFAVSNHYGGLGGGHYTAYAKNQGRWYDFNDSSVRSVSQSSVCSSGAYILFYQRKD